MGAAAVVLSPLGSKLSNGGVEESKEESKEGSYPVDSDGEGLAGLLHAVILGVLLEGSLEVSPGIVCSDGIAVWGRDG